MSEGMGIFSEVKRCESCEECYSAHEDACSCGDVNGVLLPASLFRPEPGREPLTVEPVQPPVMAEFERIEAMADSGLLEARDMRGRSKRVR